MKWMCFILYMVFVFQAYSQYRINSLSEPRKYDTRVPEGVNSDQFNQIRRAIRNFKTDDENSCSYVVTSRSCHALTSAHCLKGSLNSKNHIRWESQGEGEAYKLGWINKDPKEISISLFEYSLMPATDGKDAVIVDGKPSKMKSEEVVEYMNWQRQQNPGLKGSIVHTVINSKARLLAIGGGFSSSGSLDDIDSRGRPLDKNELENHFRYMRDTKTGVAADFAMIKLPGENCACLGVGEPKGKKMIAMGYPGITEAQVVNGGLPGTNREASFSVGLRCEPSVKNTRAFLAAQKPIARFIANILVGSQLEYRELLWKKFGEVFQDKMILHSAHSSPGSSGGSLLNDELKLIGINTLGFDSNNLDGDQHSTAISIQFIQQELRSKLSVEEYTSAFDCP